MRLYLDASAAVKLVVREEGSDEAREMWQQADRVLSARTLPLEMRSAVARRLGGRKLIRARRQLESILAGAELVEIDDTLLERAEEGARAHRLRALDAIHFAAATEVADPRLVVATWDRELSRAASAAGLTVVP